MREQNLKKIFMDKAVELLEQHLKATCESLAKLKTSDREKYSKLIDVFEEEKSSYTNAIKILTTSVETGEKNCNLQNVSVECEHPFAYVHTRCMGEIKLAQRTIALLSSMIESGESHTSRSREMKDNALNGLEQLRLGAVVGRSEQLLALAQYMCKHQNNLDGKTAKDYLQDFLSQ